MATNYMFGLDVPEVYNYLALPPQMRDNTVEFWGRGKTFRLYKPDHLVSQGPRLLGIAQMRLPSEISIDIV